METQEAKEKATLKNFNIIINSKHFSTSLVEILTVLLEKSNEINIDDLDQTQKQNVILYKDHMRLRKACSALIHNFTSKTPENGFSEGPIIKQVYKKLTQNMKYFFPDSSTDLFYLRNDNGAVVTIIPSIDMGLVVKNMTEDDMKKIWGYLYMLYISAVGMISEVNSATKSEEIQKNINEMREKVTKLGLMKDGKIFNPFVGLQTDSGIYNVETMFSNVEQSNPSGPNMMDMMKMAGIDKLIDVEQLKEQLNNVKQEEITDATKNITKLIGAENDPDINDVCLTVTEKIITTLKSNPNAGIENVFNMTGDITKELSGKLNKDKMAKVASKLMDFLQNGEANLKKMKDENGNPIGEQIMKSLEGPLKLAQSFQPGQMPNFSQCQTMMAQVNETITQLKKDTENGMQK